MEAIAVKSKEEAIKREKRKAILLVGKGNPPKDYPKEKFLEYIKLKFNLEKIDEASRKRFEELDQEIKKWPRNANNDPSYFNIVNLCEELRYALGFVTDFAFENYCSPTLSEAIYDLISRGFYSIIVVPID